MIMKEQKEIVGQLLTQGQVYEMLDLNPTKARNGMMFLLRENCFEFYVVVHGFAQYIIVSRGSFAIIPYSIPEVKEVGFIVEGDEEEEELEKIKSELVLDERLDALKYSEMFKVKNPI